MSFLGVWAAGVALPLRAALVAHASIPPHLLPRCRRYHTRSSQAPPRDAPLLTMASHGAKMLSSSDDSSGAEEEYSEEDKQKIAEARARAYASRSRRQEQEQQASELTALLFGGGGALADLIPLPANSTLLSTCAKCGTRGLTCPRVCSACQAACYCSDMCLRTDLQHSRLCRQWKEQVKRDVAVHLPGAPAWIDTCMQHGGRPTDRRQILHQLGLHDTAAYAIACGCTLDSGARRTALEYADESTAPERASLALSPDVAQHVSQLGSWADYYAARGLPPSSPLALLLTVPLTVYHILANIMQFDAAQPRAHGGDESGEEHGGRGSLLRVYLLGAELREILLAPLFRELALLMPAAKLEIVLIGPAVEQAVLDTAKLGAPVPGTAASATDGSAADAPTPFLRFDGAESGHVALSVWQGVYNRDCARALGPPHCAIALNAGLGTREYDWTSAIDALGDARTPFVVTDYYETGLCIGAQPAVAGAKLELTYPVGLNPFRQPLVWPEATRRSTALPWMCNGFICGFNTEPAAEELLGDALGTEAGSVSADAEEGSVSADGAPGLPSEAECAQDAPDEQLVASIRANIHDVLHDGATIDRSGGRVWRASEELAAWLARSCWRRGEHALFASAIELGAGVGLASIALAKLGVKRVLCTDGEPALPPLCQANATRNGVTPEQLQAVEFHWASAIQMERVLHAVGAGGRCSELIIASDVLYHADERGFQPLETTLRELIRRGGCRLVAICWQVRTCLAARAAVPIACVCAERMQSSLASSGCRRCGTTTRSGFCRGLPTLGVSASHGVRMACLLTTHAPPWRPRTTARGVRGTR